MSSARVHTRNLLANWTAFGANLVIMMFLSPFIIHTLGKEAYGIWSIMNILIGHLSIMDMGIRAGTGRYIIYYLGLNDHHKVDQTIRCGMGFYSIAGLVILILSIVLGFCVPRLTDKIPQAYQAIFGLLLPLMAVNLWINAVQGVLSSVLSAHDRFDLCRGADLCALAIRTVATIIVLRLGYGLLGLTLVILGANSLGLILNLVLARYIYPQLKLLPFTFIKERLRELMSFGIPAFITSLSVRIIGQTDILIVWLFISLGEVTTYSVGAMLLYYSATFIKQIDTTFFPPVQRAVVKKEMGAARWYFYRQIRLTYIFSLLIYIGFIMFGKSFIRLWMLGDDFSNHDVIHASTVMLILAASKLLLCLTSPSTSLLQAMGHIRTTTFMTGVEAFVNLTLSIIFVTYFNWSLAGVAAGTLAARLLTSTFVLPVIAFRKINAGLGRFLVNIAGPVAMTGLFFVGVCYVLQSLFTATSWTRFFIQVGLALIGYAPIAWFILVPSSDRQRIVRFILRRKSAISNNHEVNSQTN